MKRYISKKEKPDEPTMRALPRKKNEVLMLIIAKQHFSHRVLYEKLIFLALIYYNRVWGFSWSLEANKQKAC